MTTNHHIAFAALALPPEWTLRANCASTDPEAFFPTKGGSNTLAKKICAHCPVQAECLEFGGSDVWGIWGGLSVKERRKVEARDPADEVHPCPACDRRFTTAHGLGLHERTHRTKQAAA